MKGLEQFGTLKPTCLWMGWMDGISPDRSISRSPDGDNKGKAIKCQKQKKCWKMQDNARNTRGC